MTQPDGNTANGTDTPKNTHRKSINTSLLTHNLKTVLMCTTGQAGITDIASG